MSNRNVGTKITIPEEVKQFFDNRFDLNLSRITSKLLLMYMADPSIIAPKVKKDVWAEMKDEANESRKA